MSAIIYHFVLTSVSLQQTIEILFIRSIFTRGKSCNLPNQIWSVKDENICQHRNGCCYYFQNIWQPSLQIRCYQEKITIYYHTQKWQCLLISTNYMSMFCILKLFMQGKILRLKTETSSGYGECNISMLRIWYSTIIASDTYHGMPNINIRHFKDVFWSKWHKFMRYIFSPTYDYNDATWESWCSRSLKLFRPTTKKTTTWTINLTKGQ